MYPAIGAEKTRLGRRCPEGVRMVDMLKERSYLNSLCPVKVNLILRVGMPRMDGFHPIESLMVQLAWGDRLSLRLRAANALQIRLVCPQIKIPSEENLVVRAARMFSEAFDVKFEAQIHLIKRAPMGAGLGGGSSDAARVLRLLSNWVFGARSDLFEERLRKVAARLGADVPFFLGSPASWCTGLGERLRKVRVPRMHFVLVFPKEHVATPWAYKHLDSWRLSRGRSDRILGGMPEWLRSADWTLPELENDFELPVVSARKGLKGIRRALALSGASAALMSGSGSAFFGIYSTRAEAQKGLRSIRKMGLQGVVTENLH